MTESAHFLPIPLEHSHVAFELFSCSPLVVVHSAQMGVDIPRGVIVELQVAKCALVHS